MKRFVLSFTIIIIVLLAGCSYKDMNRLQFTTMSIIDKNEVGEIIFYSEHFVSDRGDTLEGGIVKRLVLMAKGRDIGEAFSNTQPLSPYPLAYDVKKAIAFTERLARKEQGIQVMLDLIERDQDMTNKLFMFICEDEPMKIFDAKLEDEMFTGIWLEDIMVFQGDEARVLSIRANDYLNNGFKGSRVNLLPIIKIERQPTEDRISISGAAVLVNHTMVDKLIAEEVPVYKILNNELVKGRFEVINPLGASGTEITSSSSTKSGELVTLAILKSRTKSNIDYNNEEFTLNVDINMVCTVGNVEGNLNLLDRNIRDKLIKVAENTVSQDCEDLFSKFKKKGIDLLDVESKFRRKYSNFNKGENYADIFKDIQINLNVNIKIEGGQNITYSIN